MKTKLIEVVLMAAICLIALEFIYYPVYMNEQIYITFIISIAGAVFSWYSRLKNFKIYFIIEAIFSLFVPIIWAWINGQNPMDLIRVKKVPFLEFSVQFYMTLGIIIFFVVYSLGRIQEIFNKGWRKKT